MRALIVDDVEYNRDILSRVMAHEGLEPVLFNDGLELITYCKRHTFEGVSCALMDIRMPNMNGIEAARLLREMGFKGAIIAITANLNAAIASSDCFDHVERKPITLDTLRKVTFKAIQDKAIQASKVEPDPTEISEDEDEDDFPAVAC